MLTNTQNALLNKLMSDSGSHVAGTQGKDVAIFESANETAILNALTVLGFKAQIKQDQFGSYYGHGLFWHDAAEVLVINNPGQTRWTFSNQDGPVTGKEFETLQ